MAAIVAAALLADPVGPAVAVERARPADSRQTQLQRDADAVRDAGVIGVQAQVVTPGGRYAARSGTAVIGRDVPVPRNGYFRIGSNTKTFVATVALQLEAEGRLSLDDTVEDWLPGLVKGNGNDGRKITIRNLLQHTSGLYDWPHDIETQMQTPQGFHKYQFARFTPRQSVARSIAHAPLFRPGSKWSYSNVNYMIVGMIIDKATGHSWRDEVKRRIIAPLGLRHTLLPGDSPSLPRPHAEGYTIDPTTSRPFRSTVVSLGWAGPAGEIISTADDLGRFWRGLLGGELLTHRQLKKMKTTVSTGVAGWDYGLGIMRMRLSCGAVWSHPGGTPGFVTGNAVTPGGRTSVILSESTDSQSAETAAPRQNLIDHAVCGPETGRS
ncbi:serine hydrolase domain-containing protein [Actinomadura terrae]|uniref:serine hydrolase domain-containing protein n=1 Tax=Actinomadura terrae TaxID=604353 RepID=UPI001FA81142|nr:serine hydrolase domain-containing protein [Actinomadura terrae]